MAEITQYLKPQSPLQMSTNGIYPLTTADQIINEDGTRVNNVIDKEKVIYLYKATFEIDSWSGEGPYIQTATLVSMDNGPEITSQCIIMSSVMCEQTSVEETNKILQEVLGILNIGQITLNNGTITATVFEKPTSDIEAVWQIKQGG